jgi:hypothetical protein
VKGDIVFESCSEVIDEQLRCSKLCENGDGEAQVCGAVLLTTVVQQSVKDNASSLLVIKWGITVVPDLNRLEY